jgi:hypothetical protein
VTDIDDTLRLPIYVGEGDDFIDPAAPLPPKYTDLLKVTKTEWAAPRNGYEGFVRGLKERGFEVFFNTAGQFLGDPKDYDLAIKEAKTKEDQEFLNGLLKELADLWNRRIAQIENGYSKDFWIGNIFKDRQDFIDHYIGKGNFSDDTKMGKGKRMTLAFEKLKKSPKGLIFIDDDLGNIANVLKAIHEKRGDPVYKNLEEVLVIACPRPDGLGDTKKGSLEKTKEKEARDREKVEKILKDFVLYEIF